MKQLLILFFFTFCRSTLFPQIWEQKADLPGPVRNDAACFSIGTKCYILTGNDGGTYLKDVWCFDTQSNSWEQKQDLPFATGRYDVMTFSINGKGYLFGGKDIVNPYNNDLYEYNPSTDSWSQKANCPGTSRANGVGFSIGSKGYIATGRSATGLLNDLWEYTPNTNVWIQKASIPGPARQAAASFTIGNKGYVGTGVSSSSALVAYDDFYEYDPNLDLWIAKTSFPGGPRFTCVGFSINGNGYLGSGFTQNVQATDSFYEFDTLSNSWFQLPAFPGGARAIACAVSSDNKRYFGIGTTSLSSYNVDWWEFADPINTTEINNQTIFKNLRMFPNPCNGLLNIEINNSFEKITVQVFDSKGILIKTECIAGPFTSSINTIDIMEANSGIYFLKIYVAGNTFYSGKFIVSK